MLPRWVATLVVAATAIALSACGSDADPASEASYVTVNTNNDLAWAQYQSNVEFALAYEPRCAVAPVLQEQARPRVLVTGFGRFRSNRTNATGQAVSALLEQLDYPMSDPPQPGQIDPPGPQTAVALGTIQLPTVGEVDVCAMVLPVFWDLAAALVLEEIEAFDPDFVMMNGIASSSQPLWLELGAVNEASTLPDGSNILTTVPGSLLITGEDAERTRGNLLSWDAVKAAAVQAIDERGATIEAGVPLTALLDGARLAGFPRSSNTYLCNNTTYTVGYAMDHPGQTVRLMEPSHPREGFATGIDITPSRDHRATPRVFVHWPSALLGAHLDAAAAIMRTMIVTQLADTESPTRGDNTLAESL